MKTKQIKKHKERKKVSKIDMKDGQQERNVDIKVERYKERKKESKIESKIEEGRRKTGRKKREKRFACITKTGQSMSFVYKMFIQTEER